MNHFFSKDLIWLNVEHHHQQDFFTGLADKLLQAGYITHSYLSSIVAREQTYPTGLAMPTLNIAIPHTNPEHVIRPFIAITKLAHPIDFTEMGSTTHQLKVQWIFALGVTDGKEQVHLLQNLIRFFNNRDHSHKIQTATSNTQLYDVLVNVD